MAKKIDKKAALMIGASLVFSVGLVGCGEQSLRISSGEARLVEDDGSAGYLDRISSQQVVTENDAMRGFLLLLEGADKAADFKQRVETLSGRQVIGRSWRHAASRPLDKGKLAYMVYQSCKIPGGLTLQLTGPSRRYCLRELQYRKMITEGLTTTAVTGMEFVAVIRHAEEYLEEQAGR